MSDRVAVMREGSILQLGTPEEIYQQPSHLEVARFVGAPRINLLKGEIRGNGSVWVLGRLIGRVPQGPVGAACQIGFRPQVGVVSAVDGLELQGGVSAIEYTGSELIATVQLDASEQSSVFCLSSSQTRLRVGEALRVRVPLDQIHVFAADGQRLAFEPHAVLLGAAA